MTAKLVSSIPLVALGGLCLVLVVLATPGTAQGEEVECHVTIQFSPGTLNLSRAGEGVTIHADIAYSIVNQTSVRLFVNDDLENDISPVLCFPDDRGYFVAKFLVADIAALRDLDPVILVVPDENDFWLDGQDMDGNGFCGGTRVMVVDGGAKQGGKGD